MGKGIRFIGIILIGLYLGMYFKDVQSAKLPVIEWHTENFNDIQFQSPFKFELDPGMPAVPAEVQVLVKEFKQVRALQSGEVTMNVVKTVYEDKVKVSLEGAATGSINAMAKELGDQTPVPNFEPIKGKSYEGYIGIYSTTVENKKILIRAAYIVKGQNLYMVIIMFPEGSFSEDQAYKILDSIKFKN
ncbi:MAG: hypothetical protein NDI63_03075 [Pseudobdellovibrio sp.]|nr:hypothetical protein [Pseudobdellovibrio sp.]